MHPRKLAAAGAYVCLLAVGLWFLEQTALAAFGGRPKLMTFESNEAHRFTSMAMLEGSLKLRNAISLLWHDEQVWNGAVYTNWGFGVPLLQLPFHWYASHHPEKFAQTFFPDRAIFFAYLAASIPVLWAAFDRLFSMATSLEGARFRRGALSWATTALTLTCALYPLMASRFITYEEAICYFVLCELLAVSAYIFALRSWSPLAVGALGFAAGFGLLIRPLGFIYLVLWAGLVLVEGRSKKTLAAFAAGAAPLVAFWMFTNWVRSGSPFTFGTSNSVPWFGYHTAFLRFGNGCADTFGHFREAAARLFEGLFFSTTTEPTGWMKQCHFDFEEHAMARGGPVVHEPIFGVAVLLVVGWTFTHLVAIRERRLAMYAPFATLAALFAAYALMITGFAWRYSFDFWPAIVLACVQYVRALPPGGRLFFGLRLAFVFGVGSTFLYDHTVEPFQSTVEILDPTKAAAVLATFQKDQTAKDAPLPTRIACGDHPSMPFHNGLGWNADCSVDIFTNVYLGVPAKSDDAYELSFDADGITASSVRVYVNGRYYNARRDGSTFRARIKIPYERLNSPVVVATVQWTRGLDPPPGVKLRFITLS